MIENYYLVFRNSLGVVDAVNEIETGASLPLPLADYETNPLVVKLREREAVEGELDLSDRTQDPIPDPVIYRLNELVPADKYISLDRFPEDINYNTGLRIGLTTKTLDYFGLRVAQIFYQSLDAETKERIPPIPIVFERYLYNWDQDTHLPTDRVKQIHYYLEDGSLSSEFKPLPKQFYNVSDRADITTKRRETILAWLIARATELNLKQNVHEYFSLYKDQTDKYLLYGANEIISIVQNSEEPWLLTQTGTQMGTIRNAIALCFSKALEPTPNAEVTQFLGNISV